MTAVTGVIVAAAVALGTSIWWYGRREERVAGRAVAAALRACALFLALSSPWLPVLRSSGGPRGHMAVLIDRSLSMSLPAGTSSGENRIERAVRAATRLAESRGDVRFWTFGDTAEPVTRGDLERLLPSARASRAADGIERARLDGADSVILFTDGELDDREASRRLAVRLGLGVREIRVGEAVGRHAIRNVDAPSAVAAGDTVELLVEIVGLGEHDDSVRIGLHHADSELAHAVVQAPAAGRSVIARLASPMPSGVGDAGWVALDARIAGVSEPWVRAAHRRAWLRIASPPSGAVLVSTDPDWEPRYLLPLLDRAVPGGARAFLRVGDGRYLSVGVEHLPGVPESSVRRAAERSSLLVLQGQSGTFPAWLAEAARRRPAILHLARGAGPVPGTPVNIGETLAGEWYPVTPPPPGPVAAFLLGLDPAALPPVLRLRGSSGRADQAVLAARQDRRGALRPVAVIGADGTRRWAVVLSEGTWRWAARGAVGMDLYRGLYGGLAAWLLEQAAPAPVRLDDPTPAAGETVRWRVAPDVRDLTLELRDAAGTLVWSDSSGVPPPTVTGAGLAAGDARFVARGRAGDAAFQVERPFHVASSAELAPRLQGPAIDVGAAIDAIPERMRGGGSPPVWPLAAAVLLLCAEWMWRRRVGLR
jgi:hypothetical protein